ncbi:MAG: glycosyltransferase family 2 protein [Rhodospirillales bacterium]
MQKTLSVIIPSYNEETTILKILDRVAEQKINGVTIEVLVIDDGSTDGTVGLLEQNPKLYTKLIKRPRNGGKGAAVKDGLLEATGDYVLFQDADMEYDPGEYPKLLKPVIDFDADIVMGSRMVASQWTRVSYFWHKVGNKLITLVFNILNNTTFTDVYSCYLLYRRDLIDPSSLTTNGWEQHAEILSRAVAGAKTMYEVPISYYGRTYAEGKKIKAHHAIAVIWTILVRRLFR